MDWIAAKVSEHLLHQKPFVCYAKPNAQKVVGLFQRTTEHTGFDAYASGFCMVSFDGKSKYMLRDSQCDLYVAAFSIAAYAWPVTSPSFSSDEKVHFEQLVAKALQAIQQNRFQKVVLSRKECVAAPHLDVFAVFQRLLQFYPTAFRYLWYHPETGIWIGATPEQLVKKEGQTLSTVALAGTQLGPNHADLVWGEKEVQEQQLVTDYIAAQLQPLTESLTVSAPYTVEAGTLVHLKTDVQGVLKGDWTAVVDALHPTPAVCGFPKQEALRFIQDHEGYDRTMYAGYLGEWNKNFSSYQEGDSDLYVNLRCMQWEKEVVSIYVGCGINEGSTPAKEFMETVNKSMTVKRAL